MIKAIRVINMNDSCRATQGSGHARPPTLKKAVGNRINHNQLKIHY